MRSYLLRSGLAVVLACGLSASLTWLQAQGGAVALDPDDIGGTVTSAKGPEAGVWVVAETTDLPTKFARIVVTDDQGRYLLPDLPKAGYQVFVRGYGLVDSPRVKGTLGQTLDLKAVIAPDAKAAAQVYPANYWLSMMRFKPGELTMERIDGQISGCNACHQLGDKATREIPKEIGSFKTHLEAWDHRTQIKIGSGGNPMAAGFLKMGPQREMFSEWTERIAKGEYPKQAPPRPTGVERNIVVSLWDWGTADTFSHDETAGDPRNPSVNANGPIYGPSQFHDTLLFVDPVRHTAGEMKIPTEAPPAVGGQSPYFPGRAIWTAAAEPRSGGIDQQGRVWVAARHRLNENQPAFCKAGSSNKFAQYFPIERSNKQVSYYDPKTKTFTQIDTCWTADHNHLGPDDSIYFGQGGTVGWINTKAFDNMKPGAPVNSEAVQGWCPAVLDTNGDGKITKPWTEPAEAVDPTKDHRINFGCYQLGVTSTGALYCAGGGGGDKIVRLDKGPNPPETCKAEVYQVPQQMGRTGNPRGLEVDAEGVAWMNLTETDTMASFDRRKCKAPLNGPNATGTHCSEGWSFYPIGGPTYEGSNIGTDMMYLTHVDNHDILGLGKGKSVPMTELGNSDALLALVPETKQMVRFRVPYPMGFFARSSHGRIDNPNTGWKGRGIWSSYATYAPWHVEGGAGVKNKVVQFQLRPNPLAK